MGIRSSSDAPAIARVGSTGVDAPRVSTHSIGIESAAFKEEHPREFARSRRHDVLTLRRSSIESNGSRIKGRVSDFGERIVHTSQLLLGRASLG